MEHEHHRRIVTALTQHANIALDVGFQALAHHVGDFFQVFCLADELGPDVHATALTQALGNFVGDFAADFRQRAGDTSGRATSQTSPGSKHQALSGITWRHADSFCLRGIGLFGLLGLLWLIGRALLGGALRRGALVIPHCSTVFRCWASRAMLLRNGLVDHRHDIRHRRITQSLHLQRRNLEIIFHAVLNPHAHQRIQPQVNQRQLTRQVFCVVAHGLRNN